jgi:hypothetical protein
MTARASGSASGARSATSAVEPAPPNAPTRPPRCPRRPSPAPARGFRFPGTSIVVPSSSASRAANARAAIRRGCVCPMRPSVPRPASRQNFGNCVVLPDPVAPQTTTIGWRANASRISPRCAVIGNAGSYSSLKLSYKGRVLQHPAPRSNDILRENLQQHTTASALGARHLRLRTKVDAVNRPLAIQVDEMLRCSSIASERPSTACSASW